MVDEKQECMLVSNLDKHTNKAQNELEKQPIVEQTSEIIEISLLLRPKVKRIIRKNWILIIILYILFFIMRGIGCLGPENLRILILISFGLMWPLPFIFYSRMGWKAIGIRKIQKPLWFLWGFLLGVGAAFLVYFIGWEIFGNTNDHWYMAILDQVISEENRMYIDTTTLFFIATGPAIVFSPIGEEILFRGMIHETAKNSKKIWQGTIINSLAFGLIHIFHYGIAYDASEGLTVHLWTGLLWFVLMVGVSIIFTLCRERSKSIFPAIVAHSAFNLAMNVTIFLFLV